MASVKPSTAPLRPGQLVVIQVAGQKEVHRVGAGPHGGTTACGLNWLQRSSWRVAAAGETVTCAAECAAE